MKSPLWTAKIIERANPQIQWSGLVRLWTYENQRLWTVQRLAAKYFKSDQIDFLMNG